MKKTIHNFLVEVQKKESILLSGQKLFLPNGTNVGWVGKVLKTPISDINIGADYVAARLGESISFYPHVNKPIHNLRPSRLKKWLLSGKKYLGVFLEKDFIFLNINKRVTLRMNSEMSEIREGDNVFLNIPCEGGQHIKNYSEFVAGERDGEFYTIGDNVIFALTEDTKMANGLYLPTEMKKNPNVGVVIAAPEWAKCKAGDFIRIKSMPALFFMAEKPYFHTKYQNILLIAKTKEGVGESKRFFDKKNHYEQYD